MIQLSEVIAALIGILILIRWNEESWLSPGAFFSLVWTGYVLWGTRYDLPLEVLTVGLLWVSLSCLLVHSGCFWGRTSNNVCRETARRACEEYPSLPYVKTITIALIVIGLIEVGTVLMAPGASIGETVSYAYLNQLVLSNRSTFIYGPEVQGMWERAAFALIYTAPLFGGLLLGLDSSLIAKAVSILSALVPAMVGLLYGSRMGALYGGSFLLSSYMASRVLTQVPQRSSLWSVAKVLLLGMALIIGMSALVIFIRYEPDKFTSLDAFFDSAGDIFIFFPVFAIWLHQNSLIFSDLTFGNITFGRIFELFNIHTAESYYYRVEYDAAWTSSNYFTIFRGLIDDFGHIGAVVAIFLFGVFSGVAYAQVARKKILFVPMLTTAYAGIFTSLSFSVFTYVTPTIALILFLLYFVLVSLRLGRNAIFQQPRITAYRA